MIIQYCPICRSAEIRLWRQEGTQEIPVCEVCNDLRSEVREVSYRRLRSALIKHDKEEELLVGEMLKVFYADSV